MAQLIYTDETSAEATKILFEFSNDIDIYDFKLLCIRLAASMGFSQKSIDSAFNTDDSISKEQLSYDSTCTDYTIYSKFATI